MAFFPQFMYESILSSATGNPNLHFELNTVPYPTLWELKQRQHSGSAVAFTFLIGMGLSLLPVALVAFLLKERVDSLKHMQLVSGMSI